MLIMWKTRFPASRSIKALFLRSVFWKHFINVPLGIRTGEVRKGKSCAEGNVSPVAGGHSCPLLTACMDHFGAQSYFTCISGKQLSP